MSNGGLLPGSGTEATATDASPQVAPYSAAGMAVCSERHSIHGGPSSMDQPRSGEPYGLAGRRGGSTRAAASISSKPANSAEASRAIAARSAARPHATSWYE